MIGVTGDEGWAARHIEALCSALQSIDGARIGAWGEDLGRSLVAGSRLLVAGNGGSAAQAQHLTSELVGRFRAERQALSAIALHADTSAVTAIANDYGVEEVYARQVDAHGRPGDTLVLLSTSGRSPNVLRAAAAGRRAGLVVWAFTGPGPNPLADVADGAVCVSSIDTATIQEVHQVLVHLLCEAVDRVVLSAPSDLVVTAERAP